MSIVNFSLISILRSNLCHLLFKWNRILNFYFFYSQIKMVDNKVNLFVLNKTQREFRFRYLYNITSILFNIAHIYIFPQELTKCFLFKLLTKIAQ